MSDRTVVPRAVLALVVVCVGLGSGCMASFTERPVLPTFAGPATPLDARLEVSGKSFLYVGGGGDDPFMEAPFGESLSGSVSRAIHGSGWVRVVSDPTIETVLIGQVAAYQGPGPGLLSFATAHLIPGMGEHRVDVRLQLVRPGQVTHTCTQSTVVRTWFQTFLLFAYPFHSPALNRMKSTEALTLRCLAELIEKSESQTSV